MSTALALDIGGTKIAAGVVDASGRLLRTAGRATPQEDPFVAVRDVVAELAPHGVAVAGIACAGPVDMVAGTVAPINLPAWRGFPLRERVQGLVDVPVVLAGDGLCMALGEQWLGAGRGSDAMLGMVVSTGVGGGLVLSGRPFAGRSGNAGHVGHVVAEPAGGALCTCGGRGCVETVASGPSLVRWARARGWASGDAGELAAAAQAGDAVAVAAFRRGGRAVGLAVVATAAVCDVELVVIGGGVAQAGDLLFVPVRETLAEHARLSYLDELRVVPAELGTAAGLFGAAALAFDTLT